MRIFTSNISLYEAQKKNCTLLILVVFAINFISWSFFKPDLGERFIPGAEHQAPFQFSDKDIYEPIVDTADIELSKIPISDTSPVVKNVFVQKIKGDDAPYNFPRIKRVQRS